MKHKFYISVNLQLQTQYLIFEYNIYWVGIMRAQVLTYNIFINKKSYDMSYLNTKIYSHNYNIKNVNV